MSDPITAIDRFYSSASDLTLNYVPISADLINVDQIPDISLLLKSSAAEDQAGSHPGYKVFRKKGLYLSQVEIDVLKKNGILEVYVPREDVKPFTEYIDTILCQQPASSQIADEKKVTLLRTSAMSTMDDIFAAPTPENIDRGIKVVSNFVYTLMKDPKAYIFLLNLSSHDHYTLQHSVGVGANSIILAKKLGINDEKSLIEVGVGGLMHDIGKTKVPKEIINKPGPLTDEEWAEMRKHAMYGYELVKDNPKIGTRAKLAILQHHEEPAGTGYPMGLSGNQVDTYARIVCLADVYNALTTTRSYSKARTPYDAFQLIKAKLMHKVDAKMFETLVLIYGNKPA